MWKKFEIEINRIAETHWSIRPMLVLWLKQQKITQEGKTLVGNYNSYFDMWTGSKSDKFFDMGTFIRLGSCIENCLKYYYMAEKGHSNIKELQADQAYSKNIFQRILPWSKRSAMDIYYNELKIDITSFKKFDEIQEVMLNRHLFAHNTGLLDEDYMSKLLKLKKIDLTQDPIISKSFGIEDVYYFEPLKRLDNFIEATRVFFGSFPIPQ